MMKIATFENNILAIVAGTIAAEDIEPQFHALTHFPDRHAKAELADLAERLNQHDHPLAREGPFQRRGHDCRRCGPYRSFRGRPTARMVIGVIRVRGSQGRKGHIAVTDPRHSRVRVVDAENLKETRTIPVEGQPFSIVAVGGSGASH